MKKNLVYIVCAFSLILFASCNKPTAKNVPGNWCMTEYRIVESNESSDTTIETSFIDAAWQQTTSANGQQDKKEGWIKDVPHLKLDANGSFSKKVVCSYARQNDSSTVYAAEIKTGTWNLMQAENGKDADRLVLVVEEEMIINNIINHYDSYISTPDTIVRNRYANAEEYFVYNVENINNRKLVLSLDSYIKNESKQKIESENISLVRITDKNQNDINKKYLIELIPCKD